VIKAQATTEVSTTKLAENGKLAFYGNYIDLARGRFHVVPAVIDSTGRFGLYLEGLITRVAYQSTSSVKERAYVTHQLRVAIAVAHARALSREQLTMLLHGQGTLVSSL
jgi:hypothetical protein